MQVNTPLKIEYGFLKQGTTVRIDQENDLFSFWKDGVEVFYPRKGTIILDVGNAIDVGIIDIHQLEYGFQWKHESIVSTTKLLSYFPSYLKNATAEKITIFVHESPDFDCFASAYIASYYLQHGHYPSFTEELANYAEEIDSGRLMLNRERIFTPYSIALVLSRTVPKGDKLAHLERGMDLIDYILTRLSELNETERGLDSPVLFAENHPFKEEQALIEADFQKYQNDLQTICEKRRMRLPALNGDVREVDGLFWEKLPTCSMHKLWARCDSSSPAKTGYIFTFIPLRKSPPQEKLFDFAHEHDVLSYIEKTTRVIISVDGNSDVNLAGLGEALERAELQKEVQIFGSDGKKRWRKRSPRFNGPMDYWIDNEDPWYDGRNNQFQIVDSPMTGSLLSIEEIKAVVIDYAKPRVKENHSKIIFPFEFRTNDFHKLYHSLKKENNFFQSDGLANDRELVRYFRPYIREYLFTAAEDGSKYSYSFRNEDAFYLKLHFKESNAISGEFFAEKPQQESHIELLEVQKTSLSLFRYGVGFVIFDISILSKELTIDRLLAIHKELCEGHFGKGTLISYLEEKYSIQPFLEEDYENGLIYSSIIMDSSQYDVAMKKEILYKLCTQTNWDYPFTSDSKQMNMTLEKMYYDKNEEFVLGFSKKGGVLLHFQKDISSLSESQIEDYMQEALFEKNTFLRRSYFIFLLVVHQRYALMNFSKELTEIGFKNNVKKVTKLRDILFEFMMQGWFSQITDDEDGLVLHKKWMEIFETQTLYDEVLQQVSTVHDYQSGKMDKDFNTRFTTVSFIFLIITGISGFFGMNIPFIGTFSDFEAIIFSSVAVVIFVLLWFVLFGISKMRK